MERKLRTRPTVATSVRSRLFQMRVEETER
jgi:hypothetical protein